jgi:hypothetical protein
LGFSQLADVYDENQLALLVYHYRDGLATSETNARYSWYGQTGYPSAYFDGGDNVLGGLGSGSMFPYYDPIVSNHLTIQSPCTMWATYAIVGDQGRVRVNIVLTDTITESNVVVEFVIREDSAHYYGEYYYDFVVRDMLPSEDLTISSPGDSVELERYFTIDEDWGNDLAAVIFVQSNTTKNVLQATNALAESGVTLPIDQVGVDIAFPLEGDTVAIFNFSEEELDSLTVIPYPNMLPPNPMPGDLWVYRPYSIIAHPDTGNFVATMTLFYDQAEFDSSGLPEEENLQLYRCVSGWVPQGGEPDTEANSLTLSGVTGFSYWAVSDSDFVVGVHVNPVTAGMPKSFLLSQNYPNPFNPITLINYALPKDCYVKLTVYSILGQKVATLVDGEQKAGNKTASWDASSFSSGIYFYRLKAGDFVQTRKMVLIR